MAVVQNTYPDKIGPGTNGMIATTDKCVINSGVVDEDDGIPFGRAVHEAADGKIELGMHATGYRGVSVRDRTLPPQDENSGEAVYADGKHVGFLVEGDIWVKVGAAVVKGQDVTASTTTGKLSSAAVGGTQLRIPNARWLDTQAVAEGLARVRLGTFQPADQS